MKRNLFKLSLIVLGFAAASNTSAVVTVSARPVVVSRPSVSISRPVGTVRTTPARSSYSPSYPRPNTTKRPAVTQPASTYASVPTLNRPHYEYYPLKDCKRHVSGGFNGWKCVDRY
ncbi:ATP dependent DNA ligase domain [Acinetobacter baumannii]|uniref:Uncharacterized protein n=1 Tax=Acinetobacter baumannii TaxID=470 RepID=A0A9P2LC95_ACIBA|nr:MULTISPECIES: hypothetical protein [Acinetobacter calcoaceticus/baumannii complex]EKT9125638.1 hypothetical protein [Acinetobacter baumannii]EKT9273366.1 hypothetical protein [Acinetobacter baumannii]EKT9294645.1 hypothetical protein [Acinetobacter baumannii]EKT9315370.1 hypothetical protein [Acinetobacter baumannii]EKU0111043.1 hypothetical protein [Acinetobacter baumannii]